jgi:UDP-GlcNAc:undecaprenyl-phosphate/decaprenyl-phosphate GlcNAc-1-phosphate transferase
MDVAFAAEGLAGAAALSLAFSLASTPAARWTARRIGFLAPHNPIAADARPPVAYLGGIAVFAAALVAALVLRSVETARLLLAALPLTILGLADDAWPLRAAPHAVLEMACAAAGLWLLGAWHGAVLWFAIEALAVTGLVNAVNFLDVSDAFAASAAAGTSLAMALAFPGDAVPWLVLAGALAGFLAFNRPPASIYLGDAGSHLLGAVLAFGVLQNLSGQAVPNALLAALLLLAVAVFEIAFTVAVRAAKGHKPWLGSRDHIAFRLRAAGLGKGGAAFAVFAVQLAIGAAAVSARTATPARLAAIAAVFAVVAAIATIFLLKNGPEEYA